MGKKILTEMNNHLNYINSKADSHLKRVVSCFVDSFTVIAVLVPVLVIGLLSLVIATSIIFVRRLVMRKRHPLHLKGDGKRQ